MAADPNLLPLKVFLVLRRLHCWTTRRPRNPSYCCSPWGYRCRHPCATKINRTDGGCVAGAWIGGAMLAGRGGSGDLAASRCSGGGTGERRHRGYRRGYRGGFPRTWSCNEQLCVATEAVKSSKVTRLARELSHQPSSFSRWCRWRRSRELPHQPSSFSRSSSRWCRWRRSRRHR